LLELSLDILSYRHLKNHWRIEKFKDVYEGTVEQPLHILLSYTVLCFFRTGIQISLLNLGDVISLFSFHKISGPSACS